MRPPGFHLRRAALILAGALVVHELRVVAGYGRDAELIMGEPGHAYLPVATALALVLLGLAGAQFTRLLAAGRVTRPPERRRRSGLTDWLGTSAALVAVYLAQAGAESFFEPGHPILAHGGWSVLPLALAIGYVITLAGREAETALARSPRRWLAHTVAWASPAVTVRAHAARRPRRSPLASRRAGRAPPLPL